MGGGIAVLDYDRDGRLDLFFSNGAEATPNGYRKTGPAYWNRLLRNTPDGFVDVTEAAGIAGEGYTMGAAVGDFDNDGYPDLYVTGFPRSTLYRNRGGRFEEAGGPAGVALNGWGAGAAFLDFNRDGLLDLFVARYLDWDLERSRWCGEGEGTPRAYCHPRLFGTVTHRLFLNQGGGRFTDVSAATGLDRFPGKGLGVRIDDLNNDGWPDILVANDSRPQQVFLNHGGTRVTEEALRLGLAYDEDGNTYAGMGIDSADIDRDGNPDVFINALAREGYWLYRSDARGRFTPRSGPSGIAAISALHSGWGARLADFDNDGWADLFVAQGHVMDTIGWNEPSLRYREPLLLARNLFGRFFEEKPPLERPLAGRGLALFDYNGDGRLDAVVTALDEPAILLRNVTETVGNRIALALEGTKSNRDGYGAVIRADGLRIYAHPSGSYLSSSTPLVHLGLGDAATPAIEILWPSGTRQILSELEPGKVHRIREPETPQLR